MSLLEIEEHKDLYRDTKGMTGQLPDRALTHQHVSFTGTAGQSAALNSQTRYVVLTSDADCYWAEGADPTATSADRYLPAKTPRGFPVQAGNKISAIEK